MLQNSKWINTESLDIEVVRQKKVIKCKLQVKRMKSSEKDAYVEKSFLHQI